MASSADEAVTITAQCLCKAHTFKTTVPRSNLPLPASACHCDSCRHISGALYTAGASWPEPRENVDISGLKKYAYFPAINILFCGTCSSFMFFEKTESHHELEVATCVLNNGKDLVTMDRHIFVGDTVDGGASMWLRNPNANGGPVKRFTTRSSEEEPEGLPFDWPAKSSLTGYEKVTEVSIPVRCKCKGVDFVLKRNNYEGKKREELPWFIDPRTHKSLGVTCVCDSCRLFCGADLADYTFSELSNIRTTSGNRLAASLEDLRLSVDAKHVSNGTLAYYASSPHVQRYFCSTCSASIFFASDDRPGVMAINVGVLEASDGARAEGFISWLFGTIGYKEDAKGGWRAGLAVRAEQESEEWRVARGYPVNWRKNEEKERMKSR
ncbi:Mss4-like protein [Lophiotrema nucula]|uniref:Mss4-like protein n=1 Tax=Lophiotrema nucula TaxID=690887 RepID=A0A6A5Z2G7_9PLEO|nr:Mss4-like protein [Lophiotrema nucula]